MLIALATDGLTDTVRARPTHRGYHSKAVVCSNPIHYVNSRCDGPRHARHAAPPTRKKVGQWRCKSKRCDFADDNNEWSGAATHPTNANENEPPPSFVGKGGRRCCSPASPRTHLKRTPCQRHPATNDSEGSQSVILISQPESSPSHSRRTELRYAKGKGQRRVNEFFQE